MREKREHYADVPHPLLRRRPAPQSPRWSTTNRHTSDHTGRTTKTLTVTTGSEMRSLAPPQARCQQLPRLATRLARAFGR
jgi:hypothetical protein